MEKTLPHRCPACTSRLSVTRLSCEACGTEITGTFALPVLSRLEAADRQFILEFVKSSGSLKIMAAKLKLSYPSVRNRLDDIIETLDKLEENTHP